MQSSINQLHKVLDSLQPNSKGFRELQILVNSIEKDFRGLQTQTSKPLVSQTQFTQIEKTVGRMEDSLISARYAMSRIDFKDLKLDTGQLAQLQQFDDTIKKIQADFDQFKRTVAQGVLANGNKETLVGFGVSTVDLEKDFDTAIKAVERKTKEFERAKNKAQETLAITQKERAAGQQAKDFETQGLKALGEDFNKFFMEKANRVLSFQTIGTGGAGKIQEEFYKYLASQFNLTDDQIKEIQDRAVEKGKITARGISQALQDLGKEGFFAQQIKTGEKASTVEGEQAQIVQNQTEKYQQLYAILQQYLLAQGQIAAEQEKANGAIKNATEETNAYKASLAEGARASANFNSANSQMATELESFKQQLASVNSEFVKLQSQKQAFNSIQMAVTNFMGFNQVLNLTKRAISEATQHIRELDSVMTKIAIVTDMSQSDLWGQIDAYSKLAQTYGTSIKGAYEVSQIYYQQGMLNI